jgi:hypothetical protein
MEGAHGQLGSGFADGLSRYDTHGFAHVYGRTAPQVTPVTLCAQTITRFTGERSAHFHFVYSQRFNGIDGVFVE